METETPNPPDREPVHASLPVARRMRRFRLRTLLALNFLVALLAFAYVQLRRPGLDEIVGIVVLREGDDWAHVRFAQDAPRSAAEGLFDHLDQGEKLFFYDPDYDSPSDPGAYVEVFRFGGEYLMSWTNHGWGTGTIVVTPEETVEYLWAVRRANQVGYRNAIQSGDMHLHRRRPGRPAIGREIEGLRRILNERLSRPEAS